MNFPGRQKQIRYYEAAGLTPTEAAGVADLLWSVDQSFRRGRRPQTQEKQGALSDPCMERIHAGFDRLEAAFDRLEAAFDRLEIRMDRLEAALAALPWRIFGLMLASQTVFAAIIIAAIKLG